MKKTATLVLGMLLACFSFLAFGCDGGADLQKKVDELTQQQKTQRDEIETLKAKVQLLEQAKTQYESAIAALETSSDEYAQQIERLNSDFDTLSESIQNATHIERVVVTPKMLEDGNEYLTATATARASASLNVVVSFSWELKNWHSFQIIFTKLKISGNGAEETMEFCNPIELDDVSPSKISSLSYDASKTYSADILEIVLYRFS